MFGTIARVRVLEGKEQEFAAIGDEWARARAETTGQVSSAVFKAEDCPGEYYLVAIFSDRATYRANAADPETDRWYRRMRATLAIDPEWHDGEVLQAMAFDGI